LDVDRFMESDFERMRHEASACHRCDLCKTATQTVFGDGPVPASLMLVGEQPGDREDREGHPFVGPAGRVLAEVFEEVSIPRERVYFTNAVKHFKWVGTPQRRLHHKPKRSEVSACLYWLLKEIALVQPKLVMCLGATASQALLGPDFSLVAHRGEFQSTKSGQRVLATYHPSAVLRSRTEQDRRQRREALIDDLRLALPYV
jgi:uracil-DNA glycosylase family protein